MIFKGRGISKGRGEGTLVLSHDPVSFLGGVNPASGALSDPSMGGRSVKDRVFAFPRGKGSTVGSYVFMEMKRQGTLPKAIINSLAEPIVATGAVMSGVPLVDRIDLSLLRDGDEVVVDGSEGTVEVPKVKETHVVSCIVRDREKILILKRSAKVGTFRGFWSGVSGYVEDDETPDITSKKELSEEIGYRAEPVRRGDRITVRDGDIIWHVHPYLFEAHDLDVEIDWEHTEYRWVLPCDIKEYETVPGLDRVLRALGL